MPGSGLAIQDTSGRFTILHTNDEPSHLIPHPAIDDHPEIRNSAQGGYARLAGAINEIKREKAGIENRSYTSTLGVAGGYFWGGCGRCCFFIQTLIVIYGSRLTIKRAFDTGLSPS